jgi:2-dehydro-3-deoxyphosphooctonate aldolase (KDO 8-P synthase)
MTRELRVGSVSIGGSNPLVLIAGPCVIEGEESSVRAARSIKRIADGLGLGFIFKSSYLKDNRSDVSAYAGPGLEKGLEILSKVKKEVGVPVLSDVHCREEVKAAAEVLDVIQIPAYLSKQTRLALAVGATGKPVNIKKGQFIGPMEMRDVIGKIEHAGNRRILLTERGSCFGYRSLVVDMKSFPMLASFGYPVIFDVTHSSKSYGIPAGDSGSGGPLYAACLARAAVGAGCDGIFIEAHDDPANAKCDGSSMLPISSLGKLLSDLKKIDEVVRANKT